MFDVWELSMQALPPQFHLVFVAFVANDNDRRVAPEALDQLQPVLHPVLLLRLPGVQHQQVQAPLGHEKLVGGMHDLLAAEIPDV